MPFIPIFVGHSSLCFQWTFFAGFELIHLANSSKLAVTFSQVFVLCALDVWLYSLLYFVMYFPQSLIFPSIFVKIDHFNPFNLHCFLILVFLTSVLSLVLSTSLLHSSFLVSSFYPGTSSKWTGRLKRKK